MTVVGQRNRTLDADAGSGIVSVLPVERAGRTGRAERCRTA
jgi:hypothetical protein